MNPTLFTDLPPVVQLHAGAALFAAFLGPFVLYRDRRDRVHRRMGYAWVLAMGLVALSSFFIHGFRVVGPFGPIHLLSLYALYHLVGAVRAARAGRIEEHRRTMRQIYFQALGIAGLFTLLPGRAMHRIVFGTDSWFAFVAVAAVGGALLVAIARRPVRPA